MWCTGQIRRRGRCRWGRPSCILAEQQKKKAKKFNLQTALWVVFFFFAGFFGTNLEKDDEGADEHADALQQISHHVDEGRSHTGIDLLGPFSFKNVFIIINHYWVRILAHSKPQKALTYCDWLRLARRPHAGDCCGCHWRCGCVLSFSHDCVRVHVSWDPRDCGHGRTGEGWGPCLTWEKRDKTLDNPWYCSV